MINIKTLNEELDKIRDMLVGHSGGNWDICRLREEELRNELESTQKKGNTGMLLNKIMELSAKVELLTKGIEVKVEFKDVPEIKTSEIVDYETHKTSNGTIPISILKPILDKYKEVLDETKNYDIDKQRKTIDEIEGVFNTLEYENQELDMKIAEVQYDLMKKYMLAGRIEEAKEYARRFKEDIKIYARNKMHEKLEEAPNLSSESFIELTGLITKGTNLDIKDINVWKSLVEIDTGKQIDWPEEKEQIVEPKADTLNEKTNKKKGIKIKREKSDKDYDVIVVRFDETAESEISEKDIKRVHKQLHKKYKRPVKVVFEEGITKIPMLEDESIFSYLENNLIIDLTKTRIKNMPRGAFYKSKIKQLLLPDTIEEIAVYAFNSAQIEETLDLSKTKIKNILRYAFCNSRMKKLLLPDNIEKIDDTAFKEAQIEELVLPSPEEKSNESKKGKVEEEKESKGENDNRGSYIKEESKKGKIKNDDSLDEI